MKPSRQESLRWYWSEPPWALRLHFEPTVGEGIEDFVTFWAQVRSWLRQGARGDGPLARRADGDVNAVQRGSGIRSPEEGLAVGRTEKPHRHTSDDDAASNWDFWSDGGDLRHTRSEGSATETRYRNAPRDLLVRA